MIFNYDLILEYLPFISFPLIMIFVFFALSYVNKNRLKKLLEYTRRKGYDALDTKLSGKVRRGGFMFKLENQVDKIRNLGSFNILRYAVVNNGFKLKYNNSNIYVFTLIIGYEKSKQMYNAFVVEDSDIYLPEFTMGPENFFDKLLTDIDFDSNKNFSDNYFLKSKKNSESEVRNFFNIDRLKRFEEKKYQGYFETNRNNFIYYEAPGISNYGIESYDLSILKAKELVDEFKRN